METKNTKHNDISNKLTAEIVATLFAISKVSSNLARKMRVLESIAVEIREEIDADEFLKLIEELNYCGNSLVAASKNLQRFQSLQSQKKNS